MGMSGRESLQYTQCYVGIQGWGSVHYCVRCGCRVGTVYITHSIMWGCRVGEVGEVFITVLERDVGLRKFSLLC